MYVTLTVLIVIASVLLTLLVLVQNSKGGGLSAGFSSSNQVLGVHKTTDFVEKMTWGLTAFIIVLSIFTASLHPSKSGVNGQRIDLLEKAQENRYENQGLEQPFMGTQDEEKAEDNSN